MKYFLTPLLSILLLSCQAQDNTSVRHTPAEFSEMLKSENIVLIDVRTPEEFATGRIPNALNIDFLDDSFPEKIAKMDKEKTYLLYCKGGGRSEEAVKEMKELGFNKTADLEGGIMAWPGTIEK